MKTFNDLYSRIGWIVIGALVAAGACSGQNDRPESDAGSGKDDIQPMETKAVIAFDTLSHDFGTVIEGEHVVCYFDYTNDGENDLVINDVEVGCGCTSPDWDDEPLAPGRTRQLKIIFDSSGTSGIQRKSVTVVSNASNPRVRLTITARVEES